ncbi:MAG: hypothetical protein U0R44_00530 [Candidatus Micrarchaeia archaeon]
MDDLDGKIRSLAAETQAKVDDSLSKLEAALEGYDAAKRKPKSKEDEIAYLRYSFELLSAWNKDPIRARRDTGSLLRRLSRFVDICDQLQARRPV